MKKGPFTRRSDNFRDNDTKSKICISYFSEKANLQALKFDEFAEVDVPNKVVAYCSRSGVLDGKIIVRLGRDGPTDGRTNL